MTRGTLTLEEREAVAARAERMSSRELAVMLCELHALHSDYRTELGIRTELVREGMSANRAAALALTLAALRADNAEPR